MTSAFTLITSKTAYDEALLAINEHCTDCQVEGQPEWARTEATFSTGQVVFTTLKSKKPGDKFSKTILSMHNFFYKVKTKAKRVKSGVLDRIADAEMLIGVVCDPALPGDDDDDPRYSCIWSLAEALEAMIFTGEMMLEFDGRRLLTGDGETDLQ